MGSKEGGEQTSPHFSPGRWMKHGATIYFQQFVGAIRTVSSNTGCAPRREMRAHLGYDGMIPSRRPTLARISRANSSCSRVWVAVTMVRMRDFSSGTVGNPMP